MFSRVSTSVSRFLALACVISIPLALGAQNSAKPAAKPSAGDSASRWDIFAGYSFFEPNAHVDGTSPTGAKTPVDFKAERIGSVESVTRYFNDHWGLQMDSGQHDRYVTCEGCYSNSAILTVQGGLVYRWTQTRSRITPWAHALGGAGQLEGPDHQNYTPGYTFTVGGAWTARSLLIGPSGARATMSSCMSISERRTTRMSFTGSLVALPTSRGSAWLGASCTTLARSRRRRR